MTGPIHHAWLASRLTLILVCAAGQSVAAAPVAPIDGQLDALIRMALARNPGIDAASARTAAALERLPRVGALPEPTLGVRWFAETPETRVGPQRRAIELMQAVPWGGKRGLEVARTQHGVRASEHRVDDMRQQLVAQLMRSYFEAAYLQEALAVNAEESALLARFEQIALTRYSTGSGIQQSVIKVQTDLSRLEDQALAMGERLASIETRLARLTGDASSHLRLEPIALPGDACELPPGGEASAPAPHPRLAGLEAGLAAGRVEVERRRLDRKPDFRFGLAWTGVDDRRDPAGIAAPPPDNGKDAWSVSVGLNIPLWRSALRAVEGEARTLVRAAEREVDQVRDELTEQRRAALLRHEVLEQRIRLHREVIIPQARQSLSSAETAYGTGSAGFLDLFDAERVLFQARLTETRLLADHAIALTDLDQALGRLPQAAGDE